MSSIPGYEIIAKIYESASSLVYRALREKDGLPVVLKFLNEHYPRQDQIAKFRQEYQIASSLRSLDGVIHVYSIEKHLNSLAIVMEDFGAESLDIIASAQKIEIRNLLLLAAKIAGCLGEIHHANIIHKDINPSNIVLCRATGKLKLIDFGISTSLPRETVAIANPSTLEGTLFYISPEQTGRGNRSVDYRTDYYSLGATLYELLTGSLPFDSRDPLELLHCHLARRAIPPHEIDPRIPEMVSKVVLKLLSKDAEDRYQSAIGIITDLEKCQNLLEKSLLNEPFTVAARDIPEKFCLPQRLYGRHRDLRAVLRAFERVATGTTELMLLSGSPGLGKTALANEVGRTLSHLSGYFIRGKFDQVQKTEPYTGIVGAFRDLIQQILAEPDSHIDHWRTKLQAALGESGQIITSVIPDLEILLGPQPQLPEVGLTEAHNRFVLLFQRFVRVFCAPEHPLIVLLDDLHWADQPSLELLRLVLDDKETRHLLIIGAYRPGEVGQTHPLLTALESVHPEVATVRNLDIKELTSEDITAMVQEAFRSEHAASSELAEVLHAKTSGNPLAVRELLSSLYARNLLDFDSLNGVWKWDLDRIRNLDIVDSVVPLMASKLKKLDSDTQMILMLAGHIGSRFDLHTLAMVGKKGPKETLTLLWPALSENVIALLGPAWKSFDIDDRIDSKAAPVEFQFSHDRIQQAACSLGPEEERTVIHRKIGSVLLKETEALQSDQRVFHIADHINRGFDAEDPSSDQVRLAELNLLAGERAKASAAYSSALQYLRNGMSRLGDQGWEQHYQLTYDLHIQATESAYLAGDSDEMRRRIDVVLSKARTTLDRVRAHEIEIQADVASNRTAEAVSTGLSALKMLGIRFPERPGRLSILQKWLSLRLLLAIRPARQLRNAPQATDPEVLAAMRIMSCLASAAYVTVPELVPLIAFKIIRLSLKHGTAPATAYACTGLGLFYSSVMGDVEGGYRLGNLAQGIATSQKSEELKAKTVFAVNCFLRHWKEHTSETLEPLLQCYSRGLETGDIECAAVSAFIHSRYSFFVGRNLGNLEKEMATFEESLTRLNQESPLHTHRMTRQAVMNLMGQNECPYELEGESYSEREMVSAHIGEGDARSMLLYHFNKLLLSYLFARFEDAVHHLDAATPYLSKGRGTHTISLFNFYGSLSRLAAAERDDPRERENALKKVKRNQRTLKKWMKHAPMNHAHRFSLVEGERLRLLGEDRAAGECFDRAIRLARENGYLNEEALANEIAGRFYLGADRPNLGRTYIEEARYCYELWGAAAKVTHLDTQYSEVVRPKASTKPHDSVGTSTNSTSTDVSHQGSLDFESVVKMSQVISGEMKLGTLLVKLVNIMIENAGAERGFIILERDGGLRIDAEATLDKDLVEVLQSQPIEERDDLAISIVNYVARTREAVALDDSAENVRFENDPHIFYRKPKSILCMPVVFKGALTGVLYLENSLTSGAFTIERAEVLSLLCSQAAISLENARLYERIEEYAQTLEKRVRERTSELASRNMALQKEIQQRLQVQDALKQSEARFKDLAELLPQYVLEIDKEGKLSFLNRAGMAMSGYGNDDLANGLKAIAMLAEQEHKQAASDFDKILAGETVDSMEYEMIRKDGSTFPAIAYMTAINRDGEILGARGVCVDVSELKSVERRLKSSLQEKETLMREIHHRVKNNLQVMSSLLRIQSRYMQGDADRRLFEEAEHRIQSMALVHEKLYSSDTVAEVPLRDYIASLADHLLSTAGCHGQILRLNKDIEDITVGIETAIPLGFILTELVSNCFKHAFPGRSRGTISITMKRVSPPGMELVVSDDGVGIAEDFDPQNQGSMGWRLVNIFSRQLKAQVELRRHHGTEVRMRFSGP